MEELDRGWVAGLLEGEGCFSVRWASPGYKGKRYKHEWAEVRVIMQSTDRDVLLRLQSLVGGTLNAVREERANHKPLWRWYLGRKDDVVALLTAIEPLMGERRRAKITEALALVGTRRDRAA